MTALVEHTRREPLDIHALEDDPIFSGSLNEEQLKSSSSLPTHDEGLAYVPSESTHPHITSPLEKVRILQGLIYLQDLISF